MYSIPEDFSSFVANEVTSTMDLAKEILREVEAAQAPWPVYAVFARAQRNGRGRGGSQWVQAGVNPETAPNPTLDNRTHVTTLSQLSLFRDFAEALRLESDFLPLTLVFPGDRVRIPLSWVSAAAGCAVLDALEQTASFVQSTFPELPYFAQEVSTRLRLKWPNDLIFLTRSGVGQKVCGILCETAVSGSRLHAVYLGIGLNFFAAPEDVSGASSFWRWLVDVESPRKSAQRAIKWLAQKEYRDVVLARFLGYLRRELAEYLLQERGEEQLRSIALERSVPLGTRLSVNKGTVVSRFAGLGPSGALLLEGHDVPIVSGDVQFVEDEIGAEAIPQSTSQLKSQEGAPNVENDVRRFPVLALELGNSRCHWCFKDETDRVHAGSLDLELFDGASEKIVLTHIRDMLAQLMPHRHGQVVLAYTSVTTSEKTKLTLATFSGFIRRSYPELKQVVIPVTSAMCLAAAGMQNSYGSETLGTDRALRMFAIAEDAKKLQQGVAVLSAGTAFTVEIVARDGRLIESLIAPGLQSSLDALHTSTAKLPALSWPTLHENAEEDSQASRDELPLDSTHFTTSNSMLRGVYSSLVGLAATALVRANAQLAQQGEGLGCVYICGGSAHLLQQGLVSWARWIPQFTFLQNLHLRENFTVEALVDFIWKHGAEDSPPPRGPAKPTGLAVAATATPSRHPPFSNRPALRRPPEAKTTTARDRGAKDSFESFPEIAGEVGADDAEIDADDAEIDLGQKENPPLSPHGHRILKSMERARMRKRSQGTRVLPRLEDFRRIGGRVENVGVGERFDAYLAHHYRFHTRELWRERILSGEILIQHNAPKQPQDGTQKLNRVKHTYRIKSFDQLWLFHPEEYEPDSISDAEIVFDDGDTVVFSKPGNLVIHATGLYSRNTFINLKNRMGFPDAFPVHRIDRETSGLLMCARSLPTRHDLSQAFREGEMKKMYLAVCKGAREVPDIFAVDLPIGEAVGSRIRLKLWVHGPNAAPALTYFVKLARIDDYSLFACFPYTGRTNQIRIHLACLGLWIVGDKMYHPDEEVFLEFYEKGYTEWVHSQALFPRHILHNAGIQGPSWLPNGLGDNPIVCPLTPDLMESDVVKRLLEMGNIPVQPQDQRQHLQLLFKNFHGHDFERAPKLFPEAAASLEGLK